MADNITLNSGSGGATLAADDITSVWYQRVKLTDGTAGSTTEVATGNGTNTNALRVTVASDTSGVLSVDDNAGSLTVDNGGTFVVQEDGAALTALQLIDDIVATDDTTTHATGTTKGAVIMAAATPTDGSVEANDLGTVAMSTDRRLHTDTQIVGQDADITIADGGNSITVDGTVTANLSATDNAVLDSIDTAVNGTITVDLGANNDVTATNATASNFNAQVVGEVANDGVDSGNPVKIGAHATNSVEAETQVANNDRVDIKADLNGVMLQRPHTTLEEIISERVSDTAGTSTNFTNFAAGGAGIHNYVTTISIYNSSATDGYVDFRDGSAGSVIFTAAAPAAGGSVVTFPVPLKGAANTALAYDVSAALSTVYISVVGFQAQG